MSWQPRSFSSAQKAAIYLATGGKCAMCGKQLAPGWHADHVQPWSKGGPTDVLNGQALCPDCNLMKGATVTGPRKWQTEALREFLTWLREPHGDLGFLVEATPGAGKTRFAIDATLELMQTSRIQRVICVVPTSRLETQWHLEFAKHGLNVDPKWHAATGALASDEHGCAVTYGEMAMSAQSYRLLCGERRTLVILDEVHHCGDDEKTWGRAVRQAFEPATVKLLLSGTPFRSDNDEIPFVHYVDSVGAPDFRYGYDQALADRIVRSVFFPRRGGLMEWERTTDERSNTRVHTFDEKLNKRDSADRLKTAIHVSGDWLPAVLREADGRLTELRQTDPSAGGIAFCENAQAARSVHAILRDMGRSAVLAISEDADSDARIGAFGKSMDPWIVSIRKVSEGVDIPRLRVGVYATNYKSDLFFRQVVGRLVRTHDKEEDPTAFLFIPDDPDLRTMATEIMKTRDAQLDNDIFCPGPGGGPGGGEDSTFVPLSASTATDAGVIVNSSIITPSELAFAESVKLKDPSLMSLSTAQLALALRHAGQSPAQSELFPRPPVAEPSLLERKLKLKKQNNARASGIVSAHGATYVEVNGCLNRAVGIGTIDQATEEQLQKRLQFAVEWLRSGDPCLTEM